MTYFKVVLRSPVVTPEREAPHFTGIAPRNSLCDFLVGLTPQLWPNATAAALTGLTRARFSRGKEYVTVADLTLTPSANAKVVVTFAGEERLAEALAAVQKQDSATLVHVPGLGCIAEVFPSDWRLPYLGRALDPAVVLPPLELAFGLATGTTSLDVRLLRYRPHSRVVAQYSLRVPDGIIVAEAVGKVFRSEGRAKRMHRLMESVYESTLVIPRPLALVKDASLVLMAKLPGRSLQSILNEPVTAAASVAIRAAARSLRAFHGAPVDGVKPRKASRDIETIVTLARRAAPAHEASRDLSLLANALERHAQALQTGVEPGLTHGSFKPTAVIVDGDSAGIVDLDSFALDDPARDVAEFSAKLVAIGLTPGKEGVSPLASLFTDAYLAEEPPSSALRERVRIYEGLLLAGVALKRFDVPPSRDEEAATAANLLNAALSRLA